MSAERPLSPELPRAGERSLPPLLCVVGPTASGKSALAIKLAQALDAEVLSVDASQVYRGLDIGTGKVRYEELEGVPHHLLDVVDPDERFDVSRFIQLAERSIYELQARGKRVILCGGTGLYFKGLLYGLCEAPPVSDEVRASLSARIEAGEVEQLHAELMAVDPTLAERLNPRDKQRIERALGVYLTTGVPLSESQGSHGFEALRAPTLMLGIDFERSELNERIERRVEAMWTGGFLREVEALKRQGYGEALQSMGAIGYRLAMQVIEGELTQPEAITKMVYATRQYARRQRRYFDRQLPTHWFSSGSLEERWTALLESARSFFTTHETHDKGKQIARAPFEVQLGGDKSIGHRALIFASITGSPEAPSVCEISGLGRGADLASTRAVLSGLGVSLEAQAPGAWRVTGRGLTGLKAPTHALDCGNSGTTIRLLSGLLSGLPEEVILDGDESLRRRPMRRLERALSPFRRGLEVGAQGGAPVRVGGARLNQTPITEVEVDTQLSSAQVKSAALLAGLSGGVARVRLRERALSRDHSERMLKGLGHLVTRDPDQPEWLEFKPRHTAMEGFKLEVPGDPSSASFWVAVSALSDSNHLPILLRRVAVNPTRIGFLKVAREMGVEVELRPCGVQLGEPIADLCLWGAPDGLHGVEVEGQRALDSLDELPLVALLGSVARGETVVRDATELKVKESDRVLAMSALLNTLGAQVTPTADGWRIQGVDRLTAGEVSSAGDHRVALCGRLAQLVASGPVTVQGSSSAKVSYPEFEGELRRYLALKVTTAQGETTGEGRTNQTARTREEQG